MPKKRSMRQIEKQQRMRESGKRQEKSRITKTIGSVDMPSLNSDELMNALKEMKAITPAEVAIQLNIKVSMAKSLLEELKRNRVVDIVSRSHNLKVYALSKD